MWLASGKWTDEIYLIWQFKFYCISCRQKNICVKKGNGLQFSSRNENVVWYCFNFLRFTETRKNMNLPYFIRMYWTNFWPPTIHAPQNIFEKTFIEVGSSHIYTSFLAPFASKLVNYSRQVSLCKMYENGKIAVFEGKWRRFRILPKV